MTIPYPRLVECDMNSDWVGGFEYPPAFRQELRDRFPDWEELQEQVVLNDTVSPWTLLDEYERRLAAISMADIIKSAEDPELHKQLVERAKLVLSTHDFVRDIHTRYFPQGVDHEVHTLMSKK